VKYTSKNNRYYNNNEPALIRCFLYKIEMKMNYYRINYEGYKDLFLIISCVFNKLKRKLKIKEERRI
jgi:hypothetical protein